MSDTLLVVAMAAITYGSRAVFLARTGRLPTGRIAVFLERFPLALFVSLATATLLVPDADVEPALGYTALGAGLAGAIATRRSMVGVLLCGGAGYAVARWIAG
jgi:branched-subunit amino acid transport protein